MAEEGRMRTGFKMKTLNAPVCGVVDPSSLIAVPAEAPAFGGGWSLGDNDRLRRVKVRRTALLLLCLK